MHVRSTLKELGLDARRSMGQNFLVDPSVASRIVEIANFGPEDRVLEIGPGLGFLTRRLLMRGARVKAIEKDRGLAEALRRELPMVDLIEGDALDYPFEQGLEGTGWVCVSNLPYNVATPILGRLVRMGALFDRLLLMFQKEVGERLSARRGSKAWGALSLDIQTWAEVEPRLLVPPEAFHPRPKVNSMVVEVRPRLEPATFGATPAAFHATVRAAFGQRRKTLRNALGAIYGRDVAEEALQRAGVDPGERAERLTPEEFGRLAQALHADGGRAS